MRFNNLQKSLFTLVFLTSLVPGFVSASTCTDGCGSTANDAITSCAKTQQADVGKGVNPQTAMATYESCSREARKKGEDCKKACTGSASGGAATSATVTLLNPLGLSDPRQIVGRIIKGILSIVGTITLAMFMYGGILWITSMGESKKVEKGKSIFVWTTLGLGIIAIAYTAVTAIMNALRTGSVT